MQCFLTFKRNPHIKQSRTPSRFQPHLHKVFNNLVAQSRSVCDDMNFVFLGRELKDIHKVTFHERLTTSKGDQRKSGKFGNCFFHFLARHFILISFFRFRFFYNFQVMAHVTTQVATIGHFEESLHGWQRKSRRQIERQKRIKTW